MSTPTHVFIAGIGNSGPDHWQSLWRDRTDGAVWVEHTSWDEPERDTWVAELDAALRAVPGPKVLVAHSLGCTLVAEWAAEHRDEDVTAALLVAVPDVDGPEFPTQATGFDSARHGRLPFRSLVVSSQDDPYGSPEHAAADAELFGAELVDVGHRGHINAESGLGDWPEGRALLDQLLGG
ncbi:RBBP9/YdeN family alpha/beta hydrolase [Kitasatospora sp. NPDC004272]